MGKRSKKPTSGFPTDNDTDSVASCSTWTTYTDSPEHEIIDVCSQAIDDLFEKRGSTREKALAQLLTYFREDYRPEDAARNESTVVGRCINGVRRGGNTEAALSAQLLGLHLISHPEPCESLFQEPRFDLQSAAKSGASTEVHCAAVDSLAMSCFVAVEDDMLVAEVMSQLRALWRPAGDPKVTAAALRGWCLLFTRLRTLPASSTVEGLLSDLAALLHASNTEVRTTAGETLALLHDSCGLRNVLQSYAEQADEEEEEDEEYTDGQADGAQQADGDAEVASTTGSSTAAAANGGVGALVGRMRTLATGHHNPTEQRRSRKDRAASRTAFRSVLKVVEHGRVAPVKIKLQHGDVLVVDTLPGTVQINAFRRFLAGGFQVHLQRNPLLHACFDFTPAVAKERLTASEKRMMRSPNSADAKWRTYERKGDRAYKASRHAAALAYDDGA